MKQTNKHTSLVLTTHTKEQILQTYKNFNLKSLDTSAHMRHLELTTTNQKRTILLLQYIVKDQINIYYYYAIPFFFI